MIAQGMQRTGFDSDSAVTFYTRGLDFWFYSLFLFTSGWDFNTKLAWADEVSPMVLGVYIGKNTHISPREGASLIYFWFGFRVFTNFYHFAFI